MSTLNRLALHDLKDTYQRRIGVSKSGGPPIHETIRLNTQKTCHVKGCGKNRHRISKFCSKHSWHDHFYGHPLAVALKDSEFATEKAQVASIIDLNKGKHKGIQGALAHLSALLSPPGNEYSGYPYPQIWCNLRSKGISAEDVLKTAAAIYLLQENSSRLIKDDRHFRYALGHAVIKLCKLHGFDIQAAMRKTVGEYLHKRYGILLMNIAKSAQLSIQQQNEEIIAQSSPLLVGPSQVVEQDEV